MRVCNFKTSILSPEKLLRAPLTFYTGVRWKLEKEQV